MTRNDIMVNLQDSNVTELEFHLVTLGAAVRHTTECAMEPSWISRMEE